MELQTLLLLAGNVVALGLAVVADKRPRDPIEYLSNWLRNYHNEKDTDAAKADAKL